MLSIIYHIFKGHPSENINQTVAITLLFSDITAAQPWLVLFFRCVGSTVSTSACSHNPSNQLLSFVLSVLFISHAWPGLWGLTWISLSTAWSDLRLEAPWRNAFQVEAPPADDHSVKGWWLAAAASRCPKATCRSEAVPESRGRVRSSDSEEVGGRCTEHEFIFASCPTRPSSYVSFPAYPLVLLCSRGCLCKFISWTTSFTHASKHLNCFH